MIGLRADLQALQRAYRTCASAVVKDQHTQAIRTPILRSIEKDFRLKELELMRWLEEEGSHAELAAVATHRLHQRCDEALSGAEGDAVPTPWSHVARQPTLTEEEPPSGFAKTFESAIMALKYDNDTYKSVRKHKNRAHQVQLTFNKVLHRVGHVKSPKAGAALVVASMLDKRLRSTASTHRWFKWVSEKEHFELWKREMDALHGGDSTNAARALARKHMQDARGRPPKQRA